MKHYIFQFTTGEQSWDESIEARGMMEAFSKVKDLREKYMNQGKMIQIEYKTVRYQHIA